MKQDRDQLAQMLIESATGSKMPAWQVKILRRVLTLAKAGKPLRIQYPPRGSLPPITIDQPPMRFTRSVKRHSWRKSRRQYRLPLTPA